MIEVFELVGELVMCFEVKTLLYDRFLALMKVK